MKYVKHGHCFRSLHWAWISRKQASKRQNVLPTEPGLHCHRHCVQNELNANRTWKEWPSVGYITLSILDWPATSAAGTIGNQTIRQYISSSLSMPTFMMMSDRSPISWSLALGYFAGRLTYFVVPWPCATATLMSRAACCIDPGHFLGIFNRSREILVFASRTGYVFSHPPVFLYWVGVYSRIASEMIGNFPAVLSFTGLFLKLNWFSRNWLLVIVSHRIESSLSLLLRAVIGEVFLGIFNRWREILVFASPTGYVFMSPDFPLLSWGVF